jgi:hypothetical protein
MGKPPRNIPRKKPPAPSVKKRTPPRPDITAQIAGELYVAFERLDANSELLAIVGSWRDTLGDFEVLTMLRDYNAGWPTLHRPQ